jgi:hypothetical protein
VRQRHPRARRARGSLKRYAMRASFCLTTVSTLAAALAIGTALAGALDCIGVQGMAAQNRLMQLPQEQQARFGSAMKQIKSMADAATNEMVRAEAPMIADVNAVRAAHPQASSTEIDRLYHEQLVHSPEVNEHYAKMLQAQYHVHMYEARMIAAGSQIRRAADVAESRQMTADYVRQNGGDYSHLATSPSFNRLLGIVATEHEAAASGYEPAATVAGIGFDNLSRDPVGTAANRLSNSAVAAVSLKTAGTLRVDHLMYEDMAGAEFRKGLINKGTVAREVSKDLAGGINNIVLGNYVHREIAHTAPPSPPPAAEQQQSWTDNFVHKVQETASRLEEIVRYAAPEIIEALPSATSSPKPTGRPTKESP